MALSFKEVFERAARTPAAPREYSGSPATLELRWDKQFRYPIDAVKLLRDCGLTLREAKDKIDHLMAHRMLVVDLPFVPDIDALIARLAETDATVRLLAPEHAAE